jgi:hypothetical protein
MGWTERYVKFQRTYGFGEGQLGFIKNIMNLTGVLNVLVFVKLYFPQYAQTFLTLAPVFITSYVTIGFVIGKVLNKRFQMVDKSRAWENGRDPMMKDIHERLKRIERRSK